MKRWTVSAWLIWSGSDDAFGCEGGSEQVFLVPEAARKKHNEAFISKEDIWLEDTFATKEEAEVEHAKLVEMDKMWRSGNYGAYPEVFLASMPDGYPEFFTVGYVEEIDVPEDRCIDKS